MSTSCFTIPEIERDRLEAVYRILRDFRTGDVHAIDQGLLDTLVRLHGKLETGQPFEVISGYRSPATNAALLRIEGGQTAD